MLAKENGWGYTRILGELKKLGIQLITRNTVKAILKRGGYDTGPNRGPGTWDEFLTRHAKTLWQCDFLHTRVLTAKGLKDIFVLIFLHVETRQVFISPSTYHPDEAWVIGQADKFQSHIRAKGMEAKILMHDRDTKFSKGFVKAMKSKGIKSHKSGFRAPNQNAFVERFIQTLQQECLDHFFVFGQAHMNHLCQEFAEHYHGERPHQGLENESPDQSLAKMLAKEKGNRKFKQTQK